jgi:molybdopterin converting factor small subunit
VRVRLFAQAREAAGRAHDERAAATLGQLLDDLRAGYGAATPLHDGDEVAVLPPVSGGE